MLMYIYAVYAFIDVYANIDNIFIDVYANIDLYFYVTEICGYAGKHIYARYRHYVD